MYGRAHAAADAGAERWWLGETDEGGGPSAFAPAGRRRPFFLRLLLHKAGGPLSRLT